MHRRSFLKGAAALAAAPVLPALPAPASTPLVRTISAEALARGAICAPTLVVTDNCMRLFDTDGPARIIFGFFDDAVASERRDEAIARGGQVMPA